MATVARETLRFLFVLLFVFPVQTTHSLTASRGLTCVNDFVSNVSCTWDDSSADPGPDCWIFGFKRTRKLKDGVRLSSVIRRSCKLEQRTGFPPGCSFTFDNEVFTPFEVLPNISMKCNGTLVENLLKYEPSGHIKMHPPGVPNVSSTDNETFIWWSPGRPFSNLHREIEFEIQIQDTRQPLKVSSWLTNVPEFREAAGNLPRNWEVRVRVQPTDRDNSQWSDWSPATTWVGTEDPNQEWIADQTSAILHFVLFGSALLITVLLAFYRSCVKKGLLKRKPVPNPAKYFQTLHSVHSGDLKKWLNSHSTSESFFFSEPLDHISTLEVCERWDEAPPTSPSIGPLRCNNFPSASCNAKGMSDVSSSSSFSNMGYFVSNLSGSSVQNEPRPAYFTHDDDLHHPHQPQDSVPRNVHICPLFPNSMAYDSLSREPQSPDSGFWLGNEEEDIKEDRQDVLVEAEEVSDLDSSLLNHPLPPFGQVCSPSSPPSLAQISSESQQMEPAMAAVDGSEGWPVAGAMYRSSSVPVESCKAGYFTLKDLQTTFSNASI